MQTALLLLTLGFGYKIYAEALRKQDRSAKSIGKLVGVFMMIVSAVGAACSIWSAAQCGNMCSSGMCATHGSKQAGGFYHHMDGKKAMCPISSAIGHGTDAQTPKDS